MWHDEYCAEEREEWRLVSKAGLLDSPVWLDGGRGGHTVERGLTQGENLSGEENIALLGGCVCVGDKSISSC